jgi:hypothetical protein
MLSTPLISKNKDKLRACNEFKYKFREVFKELKTNVGRKKKFRLLLFWSYRYRLLPLVESKLSPA